MPLLQQLVIKQFVEQHPGANLYDEIGFIHCLHFVSGFAFVAFEHDYHVLVIMTDISNYADALREVSNMKEEIPSKIDIERNKRL